MLGRKLSLKSILFLVFAALLVALSTANCSGGGAAPPDAGGDVTTNVCHNGAYKMCSGTCVDVQGDPQNCGDCGKACTADQVCSGGECAGACGNGTINCGGNGDCIDLKSDPKHCGGCTTPCATGQVCSKGTCTLTCQAGLTNCGGACVDLTSDHNNCNMCGNACASGQECVGGTCQATCQSGWTSCPDGDGGTTCVDTQNDPNNCNGCGKACTPGYFCSAGSCGLTCAGGTSLCGQACVDENIDPNHCGSCSKVCGSGNVCNAAHCCPTSTPFYCGGCNTFSNCVSKTGGHIVAGWEHTCAINPSGAAYCWGYNGYYQLGNNSTSFEFNTAQAVNGMGSGVLSMAAGAYHTCGITASGASCWGYGGYYQLGNGGSSDYDTPQAVSGGSTFVHAGGTYDATCFLTSSGAVDCAGYEYYGEIGNNTLNGSSYAMTPTLSNVTSGALSISGGLGDFDGAPMCALMGSGSIQCWGFADYGLGDGVNISSGVPVTVSGISTAAQVAAGYGYGHSCAVLSGGTLKCWGYNGYGQLGNGSTTPFSSSTPISATLTGVASVAVGLYHTCALTTSGAVECVGYNYYGQLGNGTTTNSTTWQTAVASGAVAVATGAYHSCALMASGSAYCWGYNYYGQCGNGTYTTSTPYGLTTPTLVSGF